MTHRMSLPAAAGLLALLVACAPAREPAELPTVGLCMVGSSSEVACQRISKALSQLTASRFGFQVKISQYSTADYNAQLERELLLGADIDLYCYTGISDMYRLVQDGNAEPLNDWLDQFPTLRDAVPEDYWACMTYDGQIVATPGNNENQLAIGFSVRTDVLDQLEVSADSVRTLQDMGKLLRLVKDSNPDMTPLVSHFGQTLQTLDVDPLNNGLGVLMHNQGNQVVNLYDTDEYEELCRMMHSWYDEGLILPDAPLLNIPSSRGMVIYNGFAMSRRMGKRNQISVSRSTGQQLTSLVLSPAICNTSMLNIGWCINARSSTDDQYWAMQLLEYLYTDQEASDLLFYGEENVDYLRLDEDTVTTKTPLPEEEWNTVHWCQPNSEIASEWVWPDGTEVSCAEPGESKVSPAYGFTYTPAQDLKPTVDACLEIVQKYDTALLSGYLDPDEALPQFREELHEAGIGEVVADKQAQLDAWLAQYGPATTETAREACTNGLGG